VTSHTTNGGCVAEQSPCNADVTAGYRAGGLAQ